jgi:hypothetical protein
MPALAPTSPCRSRMMYGGRSVTVSPSSPIEARMLPVTVCCSHCGLGLEYSLCCCCAGHCVQHAWEIKEGNAAVAAAAAATKQPCCTRATLHVRMLWLIMSRTMLRQLGVATCTAAAMISAGVAVLDRHVKRLLLASQVQVYVFEVQLQPLECSLHAQGSSFALE